LLSDRDPGVRAAAALGLGTLARRPRLSLPEPDRLPAVVWSREHGSIDYMYMNLTLPAREQLARLGDASSAVRRQAARTIYGSPDMTLPPELVRALQDESPEVRAAAASALRSFGTELDREIPTLIVMIERDETKVREACAAALAAAWPTRALIPALIGSLKSRDPEVRFHAAQLLGRIGPEARDAIPALIAVLNEPLGDEYPTWDPARGAARALGRMGPNQEAIAALVEVISPKKVEPLLAGFRRPVDVGLPAFDVRLLVGAMRIMAAMDGLGDIGPAAVAAVPALIAAYPKALEVRHTMAEKVIPAALARIAANSAMAADAVAVLIRALDSADDHFRLGAVEALGDFGADAAAAIPRLRALKEGRTFVSGAAAKSLAAIEAPTKRDAGGEPGRRRPEDSVRKGAGRN
jgi:HEAT repeat protein